MMFFAGIRVSPKHLAYLPGREHFSIQWQRHHLREIRDFVGKSPKQFVSVQDVAEFYQSSPESIYQVLFPKPGESKGIPQNPNESKPYSKAV